MLEKLAVTTRTTMHYTQSREKLFALLDYAEHTVMVLTEATLHQKMCELFTSSVLGNSADVENQS